MASSSILANFFEEQWTQNHPQYLSALSRALFLTTFLEIAVYPHHYSPPHRGILVYYLSGLSRANFFPTTFLEIVVRFGYTNLAKMTLTRHIVLTTLYTTKRMTYLRFQEGWIYRIFPRLDLGWTRLAQWWEHLLPANAHALSNTPTMNGFVNILIVLLCSLLLCFCAVL